MTKKPTRKTNDYLQKKARKDRIERRQRIQRAVGGLLLPQKKSLLLPPTPHEQRMREIGSQVMLPSDHPGYEEQITLVQNQLERDLSANENIQRAWEQTILLHRTVCSNGTGLIMSRTLRQVLHESFSRIVKAGHHSMNMQFNVFEAFFDYDAPRLIFEMRPEIEHLLSINDFFAWYESNDLPDKAPLLLNDVMQEGVVYSFNMTNDSGFFIPATECEFVVAGASMIRHGNELSCVIVAGENPPKLTDANLPKSNKELWSNAQYFSQTKRELIKQGQLEFQQSERYLEEFPGHCRVHVLLRFDLRSSKNICWYIAQDNGNSYSIYTNETTGLLDLPESQIAEILERSNREMLRYKDLIAASTSLIFLPVAFVAEQKYVSKIDFKTDINSTAKEDWVIQSQMNGYPVRMTFPVSCLATSGVGPKSRALTPPDIEFERDGFWKELKGGEIGEDQEGRPVAGKSWVSRNAAWVKKSLSGFLIQRQEVVEIGPRSGYVYVMRCGGHADELFKIGLTRIGVDERSQGLSRTTSSPLPFDVLAKWYVHDCIDVEKAVHEALAPFRVNERREFFMLPISRIISTIETIIRGKSVNHT